MAIDITSQPNFHEKKKMCGHENRSQACFNTDRLQIALSHPVSKNMENSGTVSYLLHISSKTKFLCLYL